MGTLYRIFPVFQQFGQEIGVPSGFFCYNRPYTYLLALTFGEGVRFREGRRKLSLDSLDWRLAHSAIPGIGN